MKYNIFQGNDSIRLQICKSLDLDSEDKISFTEPLYFTAFFYLQKRFGDYFILDDHKDAAIWAFKVKCYSVQVLLSSSRVIFMVFGPQKHIPQTPLSIKLYRMSKKGLYICPLSLFSDGDKWKVPFAKYLDSQNIKHSEATQEHLDTFYKLLEEKSAATIKELRKNYTYEDYSNAYTRHALKTLDQFLKNMLTPIWVQDVGYNIKGRCGWDGGQYKGNVEITKNHE